MKKIILALLICSIYFNCKAQDTIQVTNHDCDFNLGPIFHSFDSTSFKLIGIDSIEVTSIKSRQMCMTPIGLHSLSNDTTIVSIVDTASIVCTADCYLVLRFRIGFPNDTLNLNLNNKHHQLIKSDYNTAFIEGNIFNDLNTNCNKDLNEINFKNWVVQLTGKVQGIQQTIYTTTDALGNYAFQVDTGQHHIVVNTAPYSAYWQACQDTQVIYINQYFQVDTIDFALHSLFNCPLLQVDISTPFLRRCFNSNYHVSYTNLGGSTAQNAYVEVELDSFLTYNNSTIPLVSQVGRIYRFDIGNVAAGQTGSFSINVTVDCNNTILGQTHCVEAHIYPDTVCIPNYWNGPIITAEAICLGDTIQFNLENVGAPMSTSADYIVTEDHIMLKNSSHQLGAGGQTTIYQPTQQGATYRIIADQAAGFPFLLGDPFVTASIEGCQPLSDGTFSTGFITSLSNGNASPFIAVDCQQNVGSYDPNDKQTQPVGYDLDHYINEKYGSRL